MKAAILAVALLAAGCGSAPPVVKPCAPVPENLVRVLPRPERPAFLVPSLDAVVTVFAVLESLNIAIAAIDARDTVIDRYEVNARQAAAHQGPCR